MEHRSEAYGRELFRYDTGNSVARCTHPKVTEWTQRMRMALGFVFAITQSDPEDW